MNAHWNLFPDYLPKYFTDFFFTLLLFQILQSENENSSQHRSGQFTIREKYEGSFVSSF